MGKRRRVAAGTSDVMSRYECEGQMSIFDFIEDGKQITSHNLSGDPDYKGSLDEITRLSIENEFENSMSLFACECGEKPESYFKGCHDYFVKCPKCGRSTEHHEKMYKAMQAWNRHEVGPAHYPLIREYLRYGPHTLVARPRVEAREWLERYGVPEWVKWDKNSLPCENCTWFDGNKCCSGGHSNHYEYGYLICDGFHQSIVERKPSTVGDSFPYGIKTCQYSKHSCNKEELWKVAETLDDINCPHTCCRMCKTRSCGARCNGSEEPEKLDPDFPIRDKEGWRSFSDKPETFLDFEELELQVLGKYRMNNGNLSFSVVD